MKKMLFLLAFVYVFILPAAILAGTFIDTFDNPAKTEAQWEIIHKDWIVKDGFFWAPGKAGDTEDAVALLDIEVEDGMVIEAQCADLGDGNWQNFAIIYAYQEENLVWAAGAGVGNTSWRMFRFTPIDSKGGAWGTDFVPIVVTKTPMKTNEWYNIKVEIRGKDIILSGSSTPGSNKLDEGNQCTLPDKPEGRIGLGAAGASPMFNEFKVTAQSLAVKPGDKLSTTWAKVKALR